MWKRLQPGCWMLRVGPLAVMWMTKQAAVQMAPDVRARFVLRTDGPQNPR